MVDPHHHGRPVQGEVGAVAAEGVLAEPDERVGLHLDHRPARHIRVGGAVPLGVSAERPGWRASRAETRASMAVLNGAACSGVSRPVNSSMPSTSRMLSCSVPRFSSSRGATPSGSSHASARASTRFSWSMVSPGACATSVRSATTIASGPARNATRSSRAMIAPAARSVSVAAASASATCGCRAGAFSPDSSCRGAVASPTLTRRAASPVEVPPVAAISAVGFRYPWVFARPVRAELRPGPAGDLRRQRGLVRVQHPPHPAVPLMNGDQLAVTQRTGIRTRPHRPHGLDLRGKQIKRSGHRTNVLTTTDIDPRSQTRHDAAVSRGKVSLRRHP